MARAPGLFDVDARLRELSAKGDDLERVNALVDFEAFRPELEQAVPRADRAKGGRPPYDHVLMFRILILQASHSLSDERTEYLVKDRLSFMRFLGLSLADRVPAERQDPLRVARDVFGDALDAETATALRRAESQRDGLALLFASPAFQWRA